MDTLLAQLLTLLWNNLVSSTPKYFRLIDMIDAFYETRSISTTDLPALIIRPAGDRPEQGPFIDVNRIVYAVEMLIIARSIDWQKWQSESGLPNVHEMTRKIREVLFANKKLTSDTFEMRDLFEVQDLTWDRPMGGKTASRQIRIEYTKLELYTGMVNNQPDLDPVILNL